MPDRNHLTITSQGHPECSDVIGTASFFVVVQTVTYEILIETEHWNWPFLLITVCSVCIFYPVIFLYDKTGFPTSNLKGVTTGIFDSQYFIYILLTPCICLIVSITGKYTLSLWTGGNIVDRIRRKSNSKIVPATKYLGTHKENAVQNNRIKKYSSAINKIFVVNKGLKIGDNQDEDKDYYSTTRYFLHFQHPYLEKIYTKYIFEKNGKSIKMIFWSILLIYSGWSAYGYVASPNSTLIGLRTVEFVFIIMSLCTIHSRHFRAYYEVCLIAIIVGCLTVKTAEEIVQDMDGSMSSALVFIITFIMFNVSTYKMIVVNVLFLITYLVRVSSSYSVPGQSINTLVVILNYSVLLIGMLIISAYIGLVLEKSRRNEFALKKQLEFQLQKAQAILGYLLPDFVKNRVKQGVTYIEEKESVTVIFCDIYNFDLICATHDSTELLELLDKFFAVLDQLCEKNGVTKIETVNKTYMICGGLLSEAEETNLTPEVQKLNHAERCLEISLQILKKIEPVYLKNGNKLQVKIGINSGKVIAGVVGEHKPQFSLVGNTVNTSARMCQTLLAPDKIQISSTTYELITHEKYSFITNTVAPKGLDVQETFIVDLAKFRRHRKRDMRVNEETLIYENSLNKTVDERYEEIKPSLTMLLPQIDETHISYATNTFDLDDLNVIESEGLELVGPIQWLICTFKETKMQKKFRISQIKGDLSGTLLGIWVSIIIYVLELVMFIVGYTSIPSYGNVSLIVLRIAAIAAMLMLVISFKDKYYKPGFPWIVMLVYVLTSFISSVSLLAVSDQFYYVRVLQVMYINLVVCHVYKLTLSYVILATVSNSAIWLCIVFKALPLDYSVETSVFVLVFFAINAVTKYLLEAHARRSFNLKKFAKKEIRNTEKLLNQMMPPQVLRNLHNDITTTDKHKDATIIYADISGFTNLCKSKEPIEVVSMLSKLFSVFDHLCVRHNVYKVHTIGDCYVILSFTDGESRDPLNECVNCVEMALDMIKAIKKVNKSKGLSLAMRIGMHTGTIIAGITGTNIVRYDIYGPDNDIANKMESQGMPGKVNISQITKSMLQKKCEDRFDYTFNKTVHYAPTDTSLESYFVVPVLEADILSDQE